MKKSALIVIAILVAFGAFAKQKKKKKKKQTSNIESVEMYRTGCFGRCPTYIISINKDGIARYTAVRFCEDTGVFEKNIGVAKATELFDMVNLYKVDTCPDVYENRIPDLPTINLTVNYTGKIKKIGGVTYGPQYFGGISRFMEENGKKTDNTGWKKVASR